MGAARPAGSKMSGMCPVCSVYFLPLPDFLHLIDSKWLSDPVIDSKGFVLQSRGRPARAVKFAPDSRLAETAK